MSSRFTKMLVVLIGLCIGARPALAQWADIYSDEPHNLSYEHLRELRELLELDAPVHEILVGLHLEMMRAEGEKRQAMREHIEKLNESEDRVDWNRRLSLSMDLMKDFDGIADAFYADAKLLVEPEQFPLLDHMRHRCAMRVLFEMVGSEISGLAAQPFELLHEQELVPIERYRAIVLANHAVEAKAHDQFTRAMESIFNLQREMMEFDFDIENLDAGQIAAMTRLFKDTIDTMKRLRDLNKSLADAIMSSLEEGDRAAYEKAWLAENYEEVQEELLPERAARRVLEDDQADEELKTRVRELKPNFDRRLTTARKMARIAKHKSDLDFDFRTLMESDGPNREVYEDSQERLSEVAATYAAALKNVMTPEQRERYGLDVEEEVRQW